MTRDRHAPTLASPSNPRIRSAARLRDRRERDATGLTVVDGAREVRRALEAGVEIVEAFICESSLEGEDARAVLDALVAGRAPVTSTTEAAMAKLAFGDRSEGVVAVIRPPTRSLERLVLPDDPLIVVIEGIEKPGNVGAVLRSADGAGADAVIAADPGTDLANPNVIRASAGTYFSVPLAAARTDETIAWLRARGLRIVSARVDGPAAYSEADLTGPLALVLGSEAEGLTAAWHGPDVEAVHIPMHGSADSLNVSVSAAILLYESRRQRSRHANRGH